MYSPSADQLDKARAKDSFIFVIYGNYNNDIFNAWEKYAQKKGILFTNTVGIGHDPKREMCRDMAYWIKFKAPGPDAVLQYAYKNPELKMKIFI